MTTPPGPEVPDEPVTRRRPRRPALLVHFPVLRWWWRPSADAAVPERARQDYPELRDDLTTLADVVGPEYAEADVAARLEQNTYRRQQVLVLLGSVLVSTLAATQALVPGQVWPGIAVSVIGAALLCSSRITRELSTLDRFLGQRRRAERLRALHFEYLAPDGRFSGPDRIADLRTAVLDARTGTDPR